MNTKINNKMVAVDLFCGAGGLTVGLKQAGFNVVAGVEVNGEVGKTYTKNNPEVTFINKDIRQVSGKEILELTGLKKIDLLAGCPPCQGFSKLTDKHHRNDERNQLVLEMARLVRELNPTVCMVENVPGLAKRGKVLLSAFEKELIELGYTINRDVLQMADYGVPQSRRRLVLLAGKGFEIPLPVPTHSNSSKDKNVKPWVTLKDVLKNHPSPITFARAKSQGGPQKFNWNVVRNLKPISIKRLRAVKPGGSRLALPKSLRPDCHKETVGFENAYGRMSWDEVAPTMTSGCTTLSSGRFGHPSQLRTISVREAAIIQTFPKTYKLETENIETACELIGNALPCRFAKQVSNACMSALVKNEI